MKYLLGVASAALLLASGSAAMAAQATATVTANATVITPLTAAATKELQFGKLVMNASNSAGTLVIAAATGGRTVTGGVDLVGGTSGQAAVVHVEGDIVNGGANAYTVTIPTTATLSGPGGASMAATSIYTNTGSRNTLTGVVDISIGGTLNAAANQAPGSYAGTFDVTAAYN